MDFTSNEIVVLIDKKVPYGVIESRLKAMLLNEENEVKQYIQQLTDKEEVALDYQDKIVQLSNDISEIEQRLGEEDIEEWEIELLTEELSTRQTELGIFQHNARKSDLSQFKRYAQEYLDEKKQNLTFVYDISRLGISEDTFRYIEDITTKYNACHDKAKISLKLLSETEKITGRIPGIMTTDELKKIVEFRNRIRQLGLSKNGDVGIREIADENDCTIESVIKANALVKKVAQQIRDMGLTPLEAGLHIHEFCSGFYYANSAHTSPRVIESIVENGTIVCVGYGTMEKAIADELNMEGLNVELNIGLTRDLHRGHVNCRFVIDDKKYKVKGSFIDDACANARSAKSDNDFSASFYSLSDIDKMYNSLYYNCGDLAMEAYSSDFSGNSRHLMLMYEQAKKTAKKKHKEFVSQDSSPVISLETFRTALINKALKQGLSAVEATEYADKKIESSIRGSIYLFKGDAKNCFYRQAKRKGLKRKLYTTFADLMLESDVNSMQENIRYIDDFMGK